MHPHKAESKASHDRKLESYKSGPDGRNFSDKGTFSDAPAPDDMGKKAGSDEQAKLDGMGSVKAFKCGGGVSAKRLDRAPRASGGKVKGKTVVNIVIGQPQQPAPEAPEPPEMRSGPMPPPMMPPMGPPPGAGPMPMMRRSGGRVNADVKVPTPRKSADGTIGLDGGAIGGVARRQKIELQK